MGQYRPNTYKTCKEASTVAIKLGFKKREDYEDNYSQDKKLPSNPSQHYKKDFPGWPKFLDTEPYETCKEASNAAIKLGFKKRKDYEDNYSQDRKLPSNPNQWYQDFPGWPKFLDKDLYETWQEAGKAAQSLGIIDHTTYKKLYSLDRKLPRHPATYYKGKGYPGLKVFLNQNVVKEVQEEKQECKLILEVSLNSLPKKSSEKLKKFDEPKEVFSEKLSCEKTKEPQLTVKNQCYTTWKESIWACLKIGGIYDLISYRELKHKDPKLRDKPQLYYWDFRWGQQMFFLSDEEQEYFREKESQIKLKRVV